MKYKITGNNLQLVVIELEAGEKVYGEAGAMVYMSSNMKMEAKMKGGLMKSLGRKLLVGESMFMMEFKSGGGKATVAFGGNAPGTIHAIEIKQGKGFMAQKDAFLCAEDSVGLSIAFQKKLGALLFGGEGFIIEKLSGKGTAFIHACGDFVEFNLKAGESLKVDTGSVVGWDESVSYNIERVKGIKTMLLGGEGLFLTNLTGPGKVILQSLNLHNLAGALSPFMPQKQQNTSGSSGVISTLLKR
ncbi:MAG: TIGR00266 family protein [Candidatus Nanohalarchaeota archaeon]|nr:MAG: TIGR00266 family protein [Candidatus Nanohaloarchaeota archaeon]